MPREIRLFNKINLTWGSCIYSDKEHWHFDFVPIPMLYFGYTHYNKDGCMRLNKNFWCININWLCWGITIDNDESLESFLDEEDN